MAIQTQMNLGRVRPVYKGAYNALAAYGTLDMVLYEKEIWMMVARSYTPGDLPVDAGNGLSASGAWAKIGYQGERGLQGETGPIGPYYRPSVAVDGTFSWTNDGGLVNPDPVKIDLYWHTISGTAARVSTTQFTVAGTESVIVEGRGVRINDAILTHIKSVSVANDVTTVTVDTAVVPATISKVEVGVLNTDMLPVTSDASEDSPLWVPNSQALAAVKAIADAAVPMSMTSSTGGAGKIPIATNDGKIAASFFSNSSGFVRKFNDGTMRYSQMWWPFSASNYYDNSYHLTYPEAFKMIHSVVALATDGFVRPVYISENAFYFWVIQPDGTQFTGDTSLSITASGVYR